jgi:hypothetical protein
MQKRCGKYSKLISVTQRCKKPVVEMQKLLKDANSNKWRIK